MDLVSIANLTTSVVLAIITGIYVVETRSISRASQESAEAAKQATAIAAKSIEISTRQLEEMRQQRLDASKPYLVGHLTEALKQDDRPIKWVISIENVGNGPAI